MDDLISRQEAIDTLRMDIDIIPFAKAREYARAVIETVYNRLEQLPPAQPNNQVHLCDSCKYDYPKCPSESDDVIFGNGIGNDNICACNRYKPSAQPEQTKMIKEIRKWINSGNRGSADYFIVDKIEEIINKYE